MRANRIVQRNALKRKVAFYKSALLGAKDVIQAQAQELRNHDPGSLIIAPTKEQIIKVSQ
jgi:hypothetical protein